MAYEVEETRLTRKREREKEELRSDSNSVFFLLPFLCLPSSPLLFSFVIPWHWFDLCHVSHAPGSLICSSSLSLSSSPSLLAKSNIEHVQQLSLAPSLSLRIDMMLFLFLFFIPSFISFCYWNPVSLSFLSPSLHILFCSEFSVSRPSSSLDIRWQHSRPEVKWIHISNCCLCCCYYFYFFMQILWFFPSLLSNAWSRLRLPHATAGFSFFIRGDCPSFFNREWKRKKRKKSRLTKMCSFLLMLLLLRLLLPSLNAPEYNIDGGSWGFFQAQRLDGQTDV